MFFCFTRANWPTFRSAQLPLLGTAALFAVAASFPLRQHSLHAAEKSAAAYPAEADTPAPSPVVASTIDAQQASVLRRSGIAASLAVRTPLSLIIARITNALPAGMTLLDFNMDSADSGVRITISVMPANNLQKAQLVRSLKRQSLFDNVRILNDSVASADVSPVKLDLALKPPADEAIAGPGGHCVALNNHLSAPITIAHLTE